MKHIIISIITVLTFGSTVLKSNAQVVINEILASNTSTNLDMHTKSFGDWIELYNNNDKEISIGNWYLTDNRSKPDKWKIPFYISMGPKSYKLFWVDNLNTSNHTNFKLSTKGETIYLFDKELLLVDSMNFPQQVPDVSYGRKLGAINQYVYFQRATPMDENSAFGLETLIFSNEPVFSKEAGFYKEPFELILSSKSENERIFYTMDGTLPTEKSLQYVRPITIDTSTNIRARIYSDNKLPSKTITQTFFVNEFFKLPVVSLSIDPSYFWDTNFGIYVKGLYNKEDDQESKEYSEFWEPANYFQHWERPINLEYFDVNGNQGFNIMAGARIHGRSSRNYAQKTLAIFLKDKYGSESISYKIFGEKSPKVVKSFLLRNGGNDWGMTMFLDGLVHTLVIDQIDVDAQLYQPSIVFLNGKYWGIHNIREKVNENYIETKYNIDPSKIDMIETDGLAKKLVVSCGNFDQYNKMIEFIDSNPLSIQENYDTIKNWIDINEFINYLATEVYIANRDWPQSNMKFWKEHKSGKWRWILYDTEFSFKETNIYSEFNMLEHMLAVDMEQYETTSCSNYLIRKLLENQEFKNEFLQRMAVYLNTVFESNHILHVIDSLKQNIEPEVSRNYAQWGGIKQTTYPFLRTAANKTEWEANINYITNFVINRPQKLLKNLTEYFNLKETVLLKVKPNDNKAGKISIMGYTLNDGEFNGRVFSGIPIRLEAKPNEGYVFEKWKGGDDETKSSIVLSANKKLTAVFRKIE